MSGTTGTPGLDNAGGLARNFHYDADGRLVQDSARYQSMAWTMDSKIAQVTTTRPGNTRLAAHYLYDAGGNRVARMLAQADGSNHLAAADTVEYVVREGAGKELVRLERSSEPAAIFEDATISGSAMVGSMHAGPETAVDIARRHVDSSRYYLTDHLGNVRLEVGDNKHTLIQLSQASLTAKILSAKDYYPYGMSVPERTMAGGGRFGYNGKELDKRLGGSSNDGEYDYGFRAYDGGIRQIHEY